MLGGDVSFLVVLGVIAEECLHHLTPCRLLHVYLLTLSPPFLTALSLVSLRSRRKLRTTELSGFCSTECGHPLLCGYVEMVSRLVLKTKAVCCYSMCAGFIWWRWELTGLELGREIHDPLWIRTRILNSGRFGSRIWIIPH